MADERPWKATAEEEEKDGMWADWSAFNRWWWAVIEETLPESEDFIWDGLSVTQRTHLYSRLASVFDNHTELTALRSPPPATAELLSLWQNEVAYRREAGGYVPELIARVLTEWPINETGRQKAAGEGSDG